ncbi:restriction endonuclease subunit S [Exiguobacterium sp.]|uniref:restriction endonuclease subunit S n=1 Tax=Exiguobacterium sp. TaxID=44751 RepID=UPI00289C3ED4|nr:restriction endonuclease subunit S [Exiguobacterium sp.]
MNNSPLIRFHGYSNSWKDLKLKEHSKLITKGTTPKSKTIKGDINFIKVENLRSGKIFVSSKISENDHFSFLKRSILHEGDILFSIAGTLGRAAIVRKSILPANTNQALAIIRGYNFNSTFLLTALSGKVVREYVQKNPTVGAQPNLSLEQVGNLIISSPLIEEQNEIGIFFEKIDNIISLNQQELDALKQTKQGFLQKMFPKDGEIVPEVRFKNFMESWREVSLGTISDSYSGGTPSAGNKQYYNGTIPFIRSAEINSSTTELFLTEEGLNNSSAKLVQKGTILYAMYGATSGEVGISRIDGAINQAILAIKPKEEYDIQFLYQYLKKSKKSIVNSYLQGGQGNLSGAIIKKVSIWLPENREEQIKIGGFFRQLDEVIELKERELEALKQTKKGFLQKMFV